MAQLEVAASKVHVGGRYYHYKNPKQTYKALKLAITETDESVCVIYESQSERKLTFVRPLSNWLSTVT